jgi:hypothetical protein
VSARVVHVEPRAVVTVKSAPATFQVVPRVPVV